MNLPDPLRVAVELAAVFDELGIAYLVGGSLASSMHGMYRSTADIDVVAAITNADVAPHVARLEPNFLVDANMIRDAIRRRASFNILHQEILSKADIFVQRTDEWAKQEMLRRKRLAIDSTANRNILHKLIWFRKGNEISDRQWATFKVF